MPKLLCTAALRVKIDSQSGCIKGTNINPQQTFTEFYNPYRQSPNLNIDQLRTIFSSITHGFYVLQTPHSNDDLRDVYILPEVSLLTAIIYNIVANAPIFQSQSPDGISLFLFGMIYPNNFKRCIGDQLEEWQGGYSILNMDSTNPTDSHPEIELFNRQKLTPSANMPAILQVRIRFHFAGSFGPNPDATRLFIQLDDVETYLID